MPFSFTHLHVHSSYSPDGTAHPLALAERAVKLGYSALALTDHNTLDGHAAFMSASHFFTFQPILGAEIRAYLHESYGHVLVLTRNHDDYERLRWLIHRKKKIQVHELAQAGYVTSACLGGIPARFLLKGDYHSARDTLTEMRDLLGEQFRVEIQPTFGTVLPWLMSLAREIHVPVVATNDVHHITPSHLALVSPEHMAQSCVFSGFTDAMAEAAQIGKACHT